METEPENIFERILDFIEEKYDLIHNRLNPKIWIPIVIAVAILCAGSVYLIISNKSKSQNVATNKTTQVNKTTQKLSQPLSKTGTCGDGTCDDKEKANPNLCPSDCTTNNLLNNDNATTTIKKADTIDTTVTTPKTTQTTNTSSSNNSSKKSSSDDNDKSIVDKAVDAVKNIIDDIVSTCSDGVQNQDETGIDCGGTCKACATIATCSDGIQNGTETGVDCGGSCAVCATTDVCGDGTCSATETNATCSQDCKIAPIITSQADSPFGIFGPSEWKLDTGSEKYMDTKQINNYISDIDVKWVQEMPRSLSDLPDSVSIYSRIGSEGGPACNVDYTKYESALKDNINKYKDRVKYWEVGTEPSGFKPPNGWLGCEDGYVEYLKNTYKVIKESCPDCVVVLGGIPGVGGDKLKEDNQNVDFLKKILAYGAGSYFDGFEFKQHFYMANDYVSIKDKMTVYGNVLSSYGIDIKKIPVFIETATYDGAPKFQLPILVLSPQTETQQAAGLVKINIFSIAQGVDRVFWNEIFERHDFGGSSTNCFNFYGLINNPLNDDGLSNKKLAYYTYKKMVETLDGSDWKNIQTIQESDGVYIYKLTKNGKPIWVVWNDNADSKNVSLDVGSLNAVKITEAVPNHESGADITNYGSDLFNAESKNSQSGKVPLTLKDIPVFVAENNSTDVCGDGTCSATETVTSCSKDCSAAPTCSDGIKNGTETGVDCGGTCKACAVADACGDGICGSTETATSCSQDCKKNTTASSGSPFGVFAAFSANEFNFFLKKSGFSKDAYYDWAEQHMEDLGAHWTRSNTQFIWTLVEPTIGQGYVWNNEVDTDSIITRIYDSKTEVNWLGVFAANIGTNPKGGESRSPLDSKYSDDYAKFVQAVVERYDGDGVDDASSKVRVKYWQAGNEIMEWTKAGLTFDDYVKWLNILVPAIKKSDSSAKIVLVAPTDANSVDNFLKEVIEKTSGQNLFDAIDLHNWDSSTAWKMKAVPDYRKLLDSNGYKNVEIWSCEHGTWAGGSTTSFPLYQTELQQAQFLIKSYIYNIKNGVARIMWNNLVEWTNYSGQSNSMFNSMGLISDGQGTGEDSQMFNVSRLSYYTYKKMVETLDGSDWKNIQTIQESDNVYIYKFTNNGKPIWVAWNDNADSKTVSLDVGDLKTVNIIETIPDYSNNYKSGIDLQNLSDADFDSAFKTESKDTQDGKVELTLGDVPVFINESTGSKLMVAKAATASPSSTNSTTGMLGQLVNRAIEFIGRKCGDGVCGPAEKADQTLCPTDCGNSAISTSTTASTASTSTNTNSTTTNTGFFGQLVNRAVEFIGRKCGDGVCGPAEKADATLCPKDCNANTAQSSNNSSVSNQSNTNATTQDKCGDGFCGLLEKEQGSCSQDCGTTATQNTATTTKGTCGDGVCDDREKANPTLCPKDCGTTAAATTNTTKNTTKQNPCGDGICNAAEKANPALCPQDCK